MRDRECDPVNPLDVLTEAEVAEDTERNATWVREAWARRVDPMPWTLPGADPELVARRRET